MGISRMKIGVLPLARATFDVPYAEEKLAAMLAELDALGHQVVGSRDLLMDAQAAQAALEACGNVDFLLVLQVTFTDAAFIVQAAHAVAAPMGIWAVPEPRLGGRLRLNAFCGLNLASHALGLNGRTFGWLYGGPGQVDLAGLLAGGHQAPAPRLRPARATGSVPQPMKIARIGAHPEGFDTCAYDGDALHTLVGASVQEMSLDALFDRARRMPEAATAPYRAQANALPNVGDMDAGELDRSLRLASALESIQREGAFDGFAIRCWPETFTEYGGAVCGPVSMMGEARVPCACEADVYGAVTQVLLQRVADAPVFLADIVDMDAADGTGVVWHCGQAPRSMAATTPHATIHTNRKQALLLEFALKPGPVTLFRISQAHGSPKAVIARGEMLDRPMAFTGTSGVIRFESGLEASLRDLIGAGLEHHMALAYGDHAEALEAVAGAIGLPVLELGA
jgi:L-fucose isomerase-like protein